MILYHYQNKYGMLDVIPTGRKQEHSACVHGNDHMGRDDQEEGAY